MCLEDLDQALVFTLVGFQRLQLVAAGTKTAGRGFLQCGDRLVGLFRGVDQVLGQRADDAVLAGQYVLDLVAVLAAGLDDAAGGRVDDGGHAAGLGVESVLLGHGYSP